MSSPQLHRFTGHIAGAGTAEGTRLVLGCWTRTPHGPFADVMVEDRDGHRILLAPDRWVADFVSATYTFDEVRLVPVSVSRTGLGRTGQWAVQAGPLEWRFQVGARAPLGRLLRVIPQPIGRSLAFAQLSDPIARATMPGVRTLGQAGPGRTEWYAADDLHRLRSSTAIWEGRDLGGMREMVPPPRFGFSSTPRQPSLTAVTSTVRVDSAA
ncbi:hypothetical protein ACFWQJ_08700 [Kocuria palustris]|uniref:hypothetical protein n=1 Tax=Kocuria palustris TaxID=71999 RepID=UPI0036563E62